MEKMQMDVAVISDLHLGTYGCRANEILSYLRSITPRILVLNGDVFDIWQFSKRYFPTNHLQVVRELIGLLTSGTRIIYITGNHDEALRRYTDLDIGGFQLTDKLVIEIDQKKTWIFHGDVFDHTTRGAARFWTRMGSNGYALLLAVNRTCNKLLQLMGKEKISLSKRIMKQVNKSIIRVHEFENTCAELAIEKKYDYVICGHIHQPEKKKIKNSQGTVTYLNSGDWVEHMTALEYREGDWHIYHLPDTKTEKAVVRELIPQPQVVTDKNRHPFTFIENSNKVKIFYAVQATGNGHISRAMELLPYLLKHGTVDLMLSGSNSSLELNGPVKFRSRGLSLFYNCRGGLDYFSIARHFNPLYIRQQAKDLPVEKYDLVINDFDYITASACAKKKVPSIHFGHQASFASQNVPRPQKINPTGEWILKNYARCTHNIGLHFQQYDSFIFTPVIKEEILNAEPVNRNYITVYLPSYCEPQLQTIFSHLKDVHFEIFSKEITAIRNAGNITFLPVEKDLFNKSLIQCSGIITGAGFETPAEALHLGKKLMCIPIKGQYEQACNAAALEQLGITCLEAIDDDFSLQFYKWLNQKPIRINYTNSIPEALEYLFELHESYYAEPEALQTL